jgi:hypothetical protein
MGWKVLSLIVITIFLSGAATGLLFVPAAAEDISSEEVCATGQYESLTWNWFLYCVLFPDCHIPYYDPESAI